MTKKEVIRKLVIMFYDELKIRFNPRFTGNMNSDFQLVSFGRPPKKYKWVEYLGSGKFSYEGIDEDVKIFDDKNPEKDERIQDINRNITKLIRTVPYDFAVENGLVTEELIPENMDYTNYIVMVLTTIQLVANWQVINEIIHVITEGMKTDKNSDGSIEYLIANTNKYMEQEYEWYDSKAGSLKPLYKEKIDSVLDYVF